MMYASENSCIMEVVMVMMQTDQSMFTTSDDEELYEAVRRVRAAEVVTAVSTGLKPIFLKYEIYYIVGLILLHSKI